MAEQDGSLPTAAFFFEGRRMAVEAISLADVLARHPELTAERLVEVWSLGSANMLWTAGNEPWRDEP